MGLLILGVGGVAFGVAAWSLKGSSSLIGLFWWVLPVAVVVAVIALIRLFRT
jgi:fatty acid desaturase